MRDGFAGRLALLAAAAGLAGAVLSSAVAGPGPGPAGTVQVKLHADFDSAIEAPTAACPSLGGTQVLVLGRGTATNATHGKLDDAIGTAAECSAGQFPPTEAPSLDSCTNVTPGAPFFDVQGKGFYLTPDGSVLYLVYHEVSENPFIAGQPPFELHDCGVWQVDGASSTGIFQGATGSGTITADVPVRPDFSAHVSADYVGSITLAPGAHPPKGPRDVMCAGTMSDAPILGNLKVQKGQTCDLEHSAVNGNVDVDKGGSLIAQNSVIGGNLDCNGCSSVTGVFSTIVHDLHVHDAGSVSLTGVVVHHDLELEHGGPGPFVVATSFVDGNMRFNDNAGSSTIAGNAVARDLDCEHNDPAPVLTFTPPPPATPIVGNTAAHPRGQCAG